MWKDLNSMDVDVARFLKSWIDRLYINRRPVKASMAYWSINTRYYTKWAASIWLYWKGEVINCNGERHLLMLWDNHSGYTWFVRFLSFTGRKYLLSLLVCATAFLVPDGFISNGTVVLKYGTICRILHTPIEPHHFTLTFCPWSNRANQGFGKDLIQSYQGILPNLLKISKNCVDFLHITKSVRDVSISPQRDYIHPVTKFFGLMPKMQIHVVMKS